MYVQPKMRMADSVMFVSDGDDGYELLVGLKVSRCDDGNRSAHRRMFLIYLT